ncbi:hypothetical protein Tco_0865926 [Tanacetum coccineum]
MHTSKDDYLINTLRFVSAKEETQIYGAILPESLTSPEMKETKAYKTYLGFSTGATPPKKAGKFKKPASPKLTTVPYEEVRRKSMRDFQKTHPSGSGAIKIIHSVTSEGTGVKLGVPDVTEKNRLKVKLNLGEMIKMIATMSKTLVVKSDQKNDSDDNKTQSDNENESDFEHETYENESGLESNQEEDEDDEEEVKDELVKTPFNDSDDEDETKIIDKAEGDEDEEMDYTTSQLYDDVDIRLNEPVDTDKEFI